MSVTVRAIGNSKGFIIPAKALRDAGIDKEADLIVEEGQIILKAKKHPRKDWLFAINADPPGEEETIFMDGIEDENLIDEWTW
ncbi:MAG: AbrB/MazE/SpoVT family DNA-binding domain-containing protein [Nitrospirae bacterium]|nr:AbrB/MazE/SpoVT family DNA-binding domain-containing protein [Candidatus Manganitrophaceae bacterium]